MKRRTFIAGLGSTAAWPVVARAQQPAVPVIGLLSYQSAEVDYKNVTVPFLQGLKETGYVDGQNVAVEFRYAENQLDRLPALAADLVRRRVAVIVASGNEAAAAAKAATTTLPIAFATGGDPVAMGLVASLSRPGANVTGYASLTGELAPKRLQLLRELVPKAVRFGVLADPTYPPTPSTIADLQAAARTLGLQLVVVNARTDSDLETAFATFSQQHVGAVLVSNSTLYNRRMEQLAALAARHALPAMFPLREYALAGGLISYGNSLGYAYHQTGIYTGRILKGEKPADLPVQQATKLELAINLKTAKALGLTIPETLLATADEVTADECSDLFAAHAAELGQERDERAGQHESDARHRSEQPVSMGERCIGSYNLGQMSVKHVDIGCEPSDATARKPLEHWIFQQSGGILGGDFLGIELTAHGEHLRQSFDRRRARLRRLCRGSTAVWPVVARAQQPAMPVVGYLGSQSAESDYKNYTVPFLKGLKETGYVEGQNVAVEHRWAQNQPDRLPALAADLVRREVAVIVSSGSPAALAAKAATMTIPIVFVTAGDPVALGLVASLNRPGANVTGHAELASELAPKRMQLLHELIPNAALFGVLVDPAFPATPSIITDLQAAARTLRLQLVLVNASTDSGLQTAFERFSQQRVGAVLVGTSSFLSRHTGQLAALAARHALPAIFSLREDALDGGLISYGSSSSYFYRQAGIYTGRILKGEKPADLPVHQVTKIELVINMKTAKALGLAIPETLLATADQVIE